MPHLVDAVIARTPEVLRQGAQISAGRAVLLLNDRLRGDVVSRIFRTPGNPDPYAAYERLRAQGPVVKSPLGLYAITGHALTSEVLRSRSYGVSPPPGAGPSHLDSIELDLSLLERDPPDHTRLRRLVAPAFSPRRLAQYDDLICATTAGLLRDLPRGEPFDLVDRLAGPLPVAVITEMLGIPSQDRAHFREHGGAIAAVLDGYRSVGHRRRVLRGQRELHGIFERLIALRRREPTDDIVSELAAAGPAEITPAELLSLCQLLLIAGFETTVNLIGNAVLALQGHPDQWRLLVAEPQRAGAAIEETLRYDPPVQVTGRIAHQDTELAGRHLSRGSYVVAFIAATGRDPDVHRRPDEFDITRAPDADHLAFSAGAHYCLGAPLARLEAATALRELAAACPDLRLAGSVTLRPTVTLRGPLQVPVTA